MRWPLPRAYSIGCRSDGAEARTEPRLLGDRARRRGGPRGRAGGRRSTATSRSGWPSPTAPTWSACSPGWRGRRRRSTSARAILQVPARPPAAAAMAGATIDKLSGGRFLFGFGPSGPQVSEGWYGVPYAKPWGRTREYIEVVREIIAREGPLEHHGTHYDLPLPGGEGKALKLNFHPLRNEIPVFVGAIGRKSVRDGGRSLRRLDPDLLLRRRLRGELGRAPRGRASPRAGAPAPTSRSRPRCRWRSTATWRRRATWSKRACSSISAGWAAARPTSTSTSPTASASATSPTRSSAASRPTTAAAPSRRSRTRSSTPPRWSGTEAEVAERVERFRAAGIDRLIVSPAHLERDQQPAHAGAIGRDGRRQRIRLALSHNVPRRWV